MTIATDALQPDMNAQHGGMAALPFFWFVCSQFQAVERMVEVLLFARFRLLHLADITPNGLIECDETNEFRDFMLEKIALYCMLSNPMSFVLVSIFDRFVRGVRPSPATLKLGRFC